MTCSCKKFEFTGIFCSHILKVLSSRNIRRIPSQYILKRWTISAKKGAIGRCLDDNIKTVEDRKASMARRYKELCRMQTQIATKAAESEEAFNIAIRGLNKILEDVDGSSKSQDIEKSTSGILRNCNNNNILDGIGRVKGIKTKERVRGTFNRPKGALERTKKKKKCPQYERLSAQQVFL